jgi:hypothetical protein
MSHANTDLAHPQPPDPDRALPARPDSAGVGNILLLRTLVAFGRNVVEKLRQEDDPNNLPWYALLSKLYGTTNPALITIIFIRGLLRARALQARLSSSLARDRNALLPLLVRQGGGIRGPARARPPAAGAVIPLCWPSEDPSLDHLPTPEDEMFAEIAAKDRDRPVGAILLDICRDLGIVPALMDPTTWDELHLAITLYGGDPAPLLACHVGFAGPAAFAEPHSAISTPGPGDSPPIPVSGRSIIAYPPWPAPPDQPLPSWQDRCRKADRWRMGLGP